jgi:hypothetical protein
MMSDESYNHYLALAGQMTFNVRNLLIHLLFSSVTIVPNTCFLENLQNVNSFKKALGGRKESCKGGQTGQTKLPSSC